MNTTKYSTSITYASMKALIPILAMLDGYAMQRELVTSITYDDETLTGITFPHGEFRRVKGGWILSINGEPSVVFPNK